MVAACVGGGSNAIGMFTAFVPTPARLIGVEAGGGGGGRHCASLSAGARACCTGRACTCSRTRTARCADALDLRRARLPGRRARARLPEDAGRAEYTSATDDDALAGFMALSRTEGILPALEPAARDRLAPATAAPGGVAVLVCLSGRGDKDLDTVRRWLRAPRRRP